MVHLLYFVFFSFVLFGDNAQLIKIEPPNGRILFVVSNVDHYGESDIPASNHFAELVYPYDILINAGYQVDFVSPEGGAVPLGYFDTSQELIKQYLYDCEFMNKLENTAMPKDINPDDYKAIYYGGGGAAMFGVADNKDINHIAMHIYETNGGIVSAVCHGSIGIANLKLENGQYLVDDRKINGFPDAFENKERQYFKEFEYSVEGLLRLRGADFQYSEEGWDGFYQKDDRLITGQDPSAAAKVAELIIEQIESNNKN